MGIDLLNSLLHVQVLKLKFDVVAGIIVRVGTIVIREADAEVHLLDLFLKEILLVEEEHDGRGSKKPVVADAVEEMEALVHAVHFIIFHQDHVIGAEGRTEDNAGHSLEAVNPLLTL